MNFSNKVTHCQIQNLCGFRTYDRMISSVVILDQTIKGTNYYTALSFYTGLDGSVEYTFSISCSNHTKHFCFHLLMVVKLFMRFKHEMVNKVLNEMVNEVLMKITVIATKQ